MGSMSIYSKNSTGKKGEGTKISSVCHLSYFMNWWSVLVPASTNKTGSGGSLWNLGLEAPSLYASWLEGTVTCHCNIVLEWQATPYARSYLKPVRPSWMSSWKKPYIAQNTPDAWLDIAEQLSKRWNFHNCLGVIDGKHVAIRCPAKYGSHLYNYIGFYPIVLMAVVDAEYKFIFVDLGTKGSCSDCGTFKDCGFYQALDEGRAQIPQNAPLPNDDEPLPYCLVGDDAFGLRTWLMKPYPHRCMTNADRIFNRLSRARRVVENASSRRR